MRRVIFLLCSILMTVACSKKDGNAASRDSSDQRTDSLIVVREDTKMHVQEEKFDISLLQGVWWLDKNDVSALFMIEGDSLYYTEELNSPYLIRVNGDIFWMIRENHEAAFKLRTLTKDSLVFFDENIGENISLVRKR